MYKPKKTQLSNDSFAILNAIRNEIGGEFRANTPLVENLSDTKAYGLYVTGSGDARNSFMTSLVNRIAQVMCLVRSYENPLKRFKKGILGPGEVVENIWVGLVSPEGWTQNPASPGDVFKTNNPSNQVSMHPVNSKLLYEITTNEAELSLAFTSEGGVYDLVSRIVQRLTDSEEWDEYVMMKYVIARALLANPDSVLSVDSLSAVNANEIVSDFKGVSNNMRFMATDYNVAQVPTHSPIARQVFFLTAQASAVLDVEVLAKAFNLSYVDFLGQQQMVNSFAMTEAEQDRLDTMMTETASQGLIPGYTKFTDAEVDQLKHIVGAIIDEDFFMIFDKLYQVQAQYDVKHLNTNNFLHAWKVYSYNPFANAIFFDDVTPSVTLDKSTASISGTGTSQLTATTKPIGKEVEWTSSDEAVATVSDSGLVTGVSSGSATITATMTINGTAYTATCAVTVS